MKIKPASVIKARYREKHSDRERARVLLRAAVQKGQIKKPNHCERCGKKGFVQGHHPDYAKPYEVLWLCEDCHQKEHGKGVYDEQAYQKAYQQKRRADLRAKNLCVDCGKNPMTPGHVLCDPCLDDRRVRARI